VQGFFARTTHGKHLCPPCPAQGGGFPSHARRKKTAEDPSTAVSCQRSKKEFIKFPKILSNNLSTCWFLAPNPDARP
jgi:hypothetical protein